MSPQQEPSSIPDHYHLELIGEVLTIVQQIDLLCAQYTQEEMTKELNRSIAIQVESVHRMLRLIVADYFKSTNRLAGTPAGNPPEDEMNDDVLKILIEVRDGMRNIQRKFNYEAKLHEMADLPEYFN